MINIDRSRELHIKRANTDWWINEKAVVGANGKTYIGYITDTGEIHIKEIDAKCSKSVSRDVRLCTLNCTYSDEHNAPSVCITESGKIIVAYTGHYEKGKIRYRITRNPYDIESFGEEKIIFFEDANDVTYVQLFENTKKNEIWLFSRVNRVTWQFKYSKDEGDNWSKGKTFLVSDKGGLFYFNLRKQYLPASGAPEQWFFALYGHPRISDDHTIRSGIFNSDGQLLSTSGEKLNVNLYEQEGTINLDDLDTVYASPDGETVRLLDVSPILPLRVGFAPFVLDKPETIVYHSATFKNGKWEISEPICMGGEFLTKDMIDGSQTYLGGMAYYYGPGEAGLGVQPHDFSLTTTNRIYIARFDGENRVLESYLSQDCGKTYKLEQVIRKLPDTDDKKIWRPIVPVHAQDNMPVYWHEGTYYSHTGGWHCDTVMYVEYDD